MLWTLILGVAFAQPVDIQVDMHLDTPTQLLTKGLHMDAPSGLEAGLTQLKRGGTNVAVEVLWPPRNTAHRQRTFDLLALMEREIKRSSELVLALEPAEARRIANEGNIAVVLSLEGAHGLGADDAWRETFDALVDRGLRLLGLTWSMSNRFAGSSSDGGGGLTEEGKELVKLARERRVVIDVSHASTQTTLEICRGSNIPVVASHSNCVAVKRHSRNLSDEAIECIAKTGGVIGLNFHAPFVGDAASPASVSRLADHADHMARIGGHGVVALGSDFDGYIRKPAGLEDASMIPALWAELRRRGWTEEQIRGVKGEHFMRSWSSVRGSKNSSLVNPSASPGSQPLLDR